MISKRCVGKQRREDVKSSLFLASFNHIFYVYYDIRLISANIKKII